ncbi:MAG: SpoIIE family protein phosphatase, partial [Candidatus Eisenbacteria bacterium]|nr:SpoIIE family protein phosphatase [Candidatus Eisenbacteria bacterium]
MRWILRGRQGEEVACLPGEDGMHHVGRAAESDVRLADPRVSARHAELQVQGDEIVIRDLGSRNGTWVNDRKIEGGVQLRPGDRIRIGAVELRLELDRGEEGADRAARSDGGGPMIARPAESFLTYVSPAAMRWEEFRGKEEAGAGRMEPEAHARATDRLLRAIIDAGDLLMRPLPIDQVFDSVLDVAERAIPARRILLLLSEQEGKEPIVRAVRPAGTTAEGLLLSSTLVRSVLEDRRSFLLSDAQQDPRFAGKESIVLQAVRSALVAPLFDNERVLGLLYADASDPLFRYDQDQLRSFTLLANLTAMKITHARLLEAEREKQRMEQQMQAAALIQRELLPSALPVLPGYALHATLHPCYEVGGDLYDAFLFEDGSLGIALGDVSGKGVGAAILMAHVMAALRLLAEESLPPEQVIARLHRQLLASSAEHSFVTLFFGRLDPRSHRLTYVNAGHVPPLLLLQDGSTCTLDTTGPPLGLLACLLYTSDAADEFR